MESSFLPLLTFFSLLWFIILCPQHDFHYSHLNRLHEVQREERGGEEVPRGDNVTARGSLQQHTSLIIYYLNIFVFLCVNI